MSGQATTTVRLGQGAVRGRRTDEGVSAFLSVPYAAAPAGAARFGLPAPAPGWTGELDATRPGATAPQPEGRHSGPDVSSVTGPGWIRGGNYLAANVWTPEPSAAARLPVMVYLHGGAFVGGAAGSTGYDGTRFAQHGIVLISLNYRLGAAGFASLEGAPDNRGLRDQIAGLHWVRDNAGAFGGDSGNITVFGESAGGMSVAALLAAAPEGLFRRAISQSGGGCGAFTAGQAASVSRQLAALLGVAPTAEAFAPLSEGELVDGLTRLAATGPDLSVDGARDPLLGLSPLSTVIDGDLLSAQPADLVAAGASAGVDLMVGDNAAELNLYTVALGLSVPDDALPAALAAVHPDPGRLIAAYRAAGHGDCLFAAIGTDHVFGVPTQRLADAHAPHPGGTWRYVFTWPSPAYDGRLGACHGLELPFVFDGVGRIDYGSFGVPADDEEVLALARRTHRAWCDFATAGNPGWPPYTPGRHTTQLIGPEWATTEEPDGPERELWRGVR